MEKAAVQYGSIGGIRPVRGKSSAILNERVFCYWFISPLIPHRLCKIRGAPKVLGLGKAVYFLPQESPVDAGSGIRQLLLLMKMVAAISGVLVRGLLLVELG